MHSTKALILDTAQRLFTERGYDSVSLYDIADACGISQGNLTYHFSKKEDLVDAIISSSFEELLASMREDFNDSVTSLLTSFHRMCVRGEEHYFYFREMHSLAARYPSVKERQREFHEIGADYYAKSFVLMSANGYLRTDIPDHVYTNLAYMLPLAQMSWDFSDAHIDTKESVVGGLFDALCDAIYPFLTEKGIAEWEALRS